MTEVRWAHLRRRTHLILDSAVTSDGLSLAIHRGLIALVVISVANVLLESVPEYAAQWGRTFFAIEIVTIVVFTGEFLLRVWSAPEHTPYSEMHPWAARWCFVRSGSAIVDLLSILPFYLDLVVSADFRVLLVLRLVRFLKLARYSAGMRSLAAALAAERTALLASSVVLFGLVLVTASAMHFLEHEAQPDKFGSIPAAMWWAVVTLTTVGYGDVVPITFLGRVVGGFTMLMGVMMLALPIGIMATAFSEEIHRRDFVVTWGMLARVPLFSALSAAEIADIMPYLRAQTVAAGALIVRRGDPGDAMYFIAQGEVEVEMDTPLRLGDGEYFGEMALLQKLPRNANVRAILASRLLVLDGVDLKTLMERNPRIGEALSANMDLRKPLAPKPPAV